MLKDESGKPFDFSFEEIHQYGTAYTSESYDSFSQLLDEFYSERDRIDRTRQRSSDLQKLLSNATSRISRRLNNQRAELAACADKDELRINAELITAYQHTLGKGVPFYEVADYYNENKPRRINADPALSPSANAQKYYKEYRKAKTAEQMLATLIEQGEAELQYIDTVSDALSRASGFGEINEIRTELAASGYIKRKSVQNKKGLQKPSTPMEYRSTDGFKFGRQKQRTERQAFAENRRKGRYVAPYAEDTRLPCHNLRRGYGYTRLDARRGGAPRGLSQQSEGIVKCAC